MPGTAPKNYSIAALILVLACIIGGYVVFTNYWKEYNASKNSLAEAKANNARLISSLNSVESFLEAYDEQQENVPMVNLALPSKQVDMANFISSIATVAQSSSVVLSGVQITDPTNNRPVPIENTIAPQTISLSVSGTYLAFKDFLLRVEQHLRIIDVKHVTLGGGSTGQGPQVLQYQLQLQTYYQQ